MLKLLKKKRIEYEDRWKSAWLGPVRERLEAYRELQRIDQLIDIMRK